VVATIEVARGLELLFDEVTVNEEVSDATDEPARICGAGLTSTRNGEPLAIMPDGIIQRLRVACTNALGAKYDPCPGFELNEAALTQKRGPPRFFQSHAATRLRRFLVPLAAGSAAQ
jgi:hypothetical protein